MAGTFSNDIAVSVDTALGASHINHLILATRGAAGITLTLPDNATWHNSYTCIWIVDSAAGAMTLTAGGTDTINGAASITLTNQYEFVTLFSDGAGLWEATFGVRLLTANSVMFAGDNGLPDGSGVFTFNGLDALFTARITGTTMIAAMRGFGVDVVSDPVAASGNTIKGAALEAYSAGANANDFASITGATFVAEHDGSGDATNLIGAGIEVYPNGPTTTATGLSVYLDPNAAAATAIGINVANVSTATVSNYAIKTGLGKVEFDGNLQQDGPAVFNDIATFNSDTTVNDDLITHLIKPTSDDTYDLGTTTVNWRDIFSREYRGPSDANTSITSRTSHDIELSPASGRSILFNKKLRAYDGFTTVANGIPAELAEVNLTAQTAAIAATTIYAVPASGVGLYRISFYAKLTTVASVSSVLGGANGFQVIFTDATDSVAVTTPAGVLFSSTAACRSLNTTQAFDSGSVVVHCKASTNLQYSYDYTSVNAAEMVYKISIRVEAL